MKSLVRWRLPLRSRKPLLYSAKYMMPDFYLFKVLFILCISRVNFIYHIYFKSKFYLSYLFLSLNLIYFQFTLFFLLTFVFYSLKREKWPGGKNILLRPLPSFIHIKICTHYYFISVATTECNTLPSYSGCKARVYIFCENKIFTSLFDMTETAHIF